MRAIKTIGGQLVFESNGLVFKKYENGATINVYDEYDRNVHCFTNSHVGDDLEAFKDVCLNELDYIMEN